MTDVPRPATAGTIDRTTAFGLLHVRRHQRYDRIVVRARMKEPGTVSASGSVSIPNLAKVYKLRRVFKPATPGTVVLLRLKLPKSGLKAAKKALRHHRRVRANVTITARDKAGNVATQKRTIRLTN